MATYFNTLLLSFIWRVVFIRFADRGLVVGGQQYTGKLIWICPQFVKHRSAGTDSLALLSLPRLPLPLPLPVAEDHLRDLPGDDLRKGLHPPDSQPCQRSEQKDNDWVPVVSPHCQRLQPLFFFQGDISLALQILFC